MATRKRRTRRTKPEEETTSTKRRKTRSSSKTSKRSASPKKAGNRRSKFTYKAPDKSEVKRRQKQSGSDFDSFIDRDFRLYRPQEGDLCIRILPPTWESDKRWWGYTIFVHYDVGPNEAAYLCLNKMKGMPCPVCEEEANAREDGDNDYAYELKAKKRALVYVVDRDNEDKGPMPYSMPWTFEKDISKLMEDRRTGEILLIDHPEEGYDIEFTFEKGGGNPYKALQIAREPTPISDDPDEMDEWLEYIEEHPIPDLLNFYDYDHIEAVFSGEVPVTKKEDTDEEPEEEEDASGKDGDTEEPEEAPEEEEEEAPEEEEEEAPEEEEEELPWDDEDGAPEEEEEEAPEEPEEEEEEPEEPAPRRRRKARSRTAGSSRKKRGEGRRKLRKNLKE